MRIPGRYTVERAHEGHPRILARLRRYRRRRLLRVMERNARWTKEAQDAPALSTLMNPRS